LFEREKEMMQALQKRWRAQGGYRQLLAIATPLILSTGAWSVQHFVDRMFLSWYSPEAIAAAMPSGMVSFAVMSFFLGTATYVSTFVAQYYGAKRFSRIGPVLWQGVYIALIGGLVQICLIPFADAIFSFVGHDPLVQRNEVQYFQILCFGGFPFVASAALSGFFSGRGKPWAVMWVNTCATIVNLVLDYALIFGVWGFPELGIKGAAIATVLSGAFSFGVYLVLISRKIYNERYHALKGWRPEGELFVRLLRFGFPSGVQFFLEMVGFTVFILLIGRLGTNALASTNIAFNINTLAFMPMIGCGIAVSVLVGQYLGANKPALAQRSTYSGFHMTFLYMVTIAAAYVVVPNIFVAPFAAKANPEGMAEIYHLAVILLRFVAVYSVFDTMNIIFASAIKGAGDTRFVMFMILIISALILVLPAYIAIVILDCGLTIAWGIGASYVIVLGFVFYLRFRSGKWKGMRVIEQPVVDVKPE
jgi:MATE family multidrug resistance protein